jgi:phosphoribosylformylglycinamidine synthase subunit PurS
MKVKIYIMPKPSVLDPQGRAIENSLKNMNINDVQSLRVGKLMELVIDEANEEIAREKVNAMCKDFLVNNLVENYHLEIVK